MNITHTEYQPTPKLTLFGTLAKVYNNLCDTANALADDITCNVKGNIESIKTYVNTKIANPDEREYLTTKINAYSKSIQEITKDVTDTTIKTASTLKKRAYAPEDPRESLRALYVLEKKITNIINIKLDVPSIDVETMKDLLKIDATIYENKLNNLIELIFNLYNKNVLGNEETIDVSNTQKLLFIGYLFCEPQPKDTSGKHLEESPIPYNSLFATKEDMSDDEIEDEYNRICKFEKEAKIEDKEQPAPNTVFERVPLDGDGDVVMVQPEKKQKKEGGKKSKKRNKKNKARKTKKNKRSLKKKAHKKK